MKSESRSSFLSLTKSGASMLNRGTLLKIFFFWRTDFPFRSWYAIPPVMTLARITSSLVIGQLYSVPGLISALINWVSDGQPILLCSVLADSAPCTSDRL
jgi:hypothetical protein